MGALRLGDVGRRGAKHAEVATLKIECMEAAGECRSGFLSSEVLAWPFYEQITEAEDVPDAHIWVQHAPSVLTSIPATSLSP